MYGYSYQYGRILGKGGGAAPFVGLLDTYSGAAAAYSLRQLSSSYSGDAIRVRRASDNAELNIGFVANELDTASLTTFCSGTNGFVTTWYDQSGNARNAVETVAVNQPKIYDSILGVVLTNGKPAMTFDGVNDGLISSLGSVTNFTAFNVVQQQTLQSAYRSYYGGANIFRNVMGQEPSFKYYLLGGNQFISPETRNLNQNLFYSLFNGALSELQINANLYSGSITAATTNNMYICRSFYGEFANANYQEFILYNSNQSSNRIGINTNINDYYGIY